MATSPQAPQQKRRKMLDKSHLLALRPNAIQSLDHLKNDLPNRKSSPALLAVYRASWQDETRKPDLRVSRLHRPRYRFLRPEREIQLVGVVFQAVFIFFGISVNL